MSEALEYMAETVADAAARASRNVIKSELTKLLNAERFEAEIEFHIGTGEPYISVFIPALHESFYIGNVVFKGPGSFPLQPHYSAQAEECQKEINLYRDFAAKLIAMADAQQSKLDSFISPKP